VIERLLWEADKNLKLGKKENKRGTRGGELTVTNGAGDRPIRGGE